MPSSLGTNRLLWIAAFFVSAFVGCTKDVPTEVAKPDPMPTVRIISPLNNAEVFDSTVVEVDASDDKGVTKVEIYIDNQLDSSRVFITKPYRWIWRTENLADSSVHTVFAKAYDVDSNVSSTPLNTVTAYKLMPSGLTGSIISDTLISLSWKDNSRKETGFEIEQDLNKGGFVVVKTVGSNVTKTEVTGAYKTIDQVSFRVRAIIGEIKSKYSNRLLKNS